MVSPKLADQQPGFVEQVDAQADLDGNCSVLINVETFLLSFLTKYVEVKPTPRRTTHAKKI